MDTIKIGRTEFNKSAFKDMTEVEFTKFCKEQKVILPRGMSEKEAFKKVTAKAIISK